MRLHSMDARLLFQVIDIETRKLIDGVSIQVQRPHDGTPACPSILADASGNGISPVRPGSISLVRLSRSGFESTSITETVTLTSTEQRAYQVAMRQLVDVIN